MSKEAEIKKCGVVMPISAIDGCSEAHWGDVYAIVIKAAKSAGFIPELVSYGDEAGIIQKRIIQNLYSNPIVVCDVSGKNPNVMFELGMRLAFDKPTIVIKDDKTSYSFDTSPLEHLTYPRDLRYQSIVDFQDSLAQKIMATHQKAQEDPKYSTFLKHFGDFTIPKIEQETVPSDVYIMEQLRSLADSVERLDRKTTRENNLSSRLFNTKTIKEFTDWATTPDLVGMPDIILDPKKGAEEKAVKVLRALSCVRKLNTITVNGKRSIYIQLYEATKENLSLVENAIISYGVVNHLLT